MPLKLISEEILNSYQEKLVWLRDSPGSMLKSCDVAGVPTVSVTAQFQRRGIQSHLDGDASWGRNGGGFGQEEKGGKRQ